METSGKFINFLLIITVVIVTQGTTYGQGTVPCCSEQTENITECCLCNSSSCSTLSLKTHNSNKTGKCILSTTSTEATSIDNISPPPEEDEGIVQVTLCVSACPGGFYEDHNQTCQPCDKLCKNCTVDTCLECIYGMNSSGNCCPNGTQSKTSGNFTICEVTPQSNTGSQDDDKLYVIIGCVVGVLVVIGLLVVVVCLCCRRQENGQQGQKRPISRLLELRKRKNYDYPDFQLPSANELKSVEESIVSGGRRPGAYENTATLDHRDLARRAQQEQDRIGRYARDPTGKKKKGNQSSANDDEEPQETYENQPTIDLHNKQSEVHKKKKGPFNKLSQKFRSKKGHKEDAKTRRKTEPPAVTEPLEEYEDVNNPSPQGDIPTETYEAVGSGHPDFPQENYEGVDMSVNLNDDMPMEEYTAMDPSTLQPQEANQPKIKSKKRKKTRGVSQKGAENPTFSGENPYANYTPGAQQIQQSESDYQNYQNLVVGPEEEYANY